MNLWLVRHAQPLIGAGICYGATDVAADDALTRTAAQSLAGVLPTDTVCRISPLQRCQQLAAALTSIRPDLSLKPAICTDHRLAEMNFGCFEGQSWASIPKADLDAWTASFGSHRFGGNESANDVLQRVAAALQDCREQSRPNSNLLWITHAGVIRAVRLLIQGITRLDSATQWPREVPGFGGWVRVDV